MHVRLSQGGQYPPCSKQLRNEVHLDALCKCRFFRTMPRVRLHSTSRARMACDDDGISALSSGQLAFEMSFLIWCCAPIFSGSVLLPTRASVLLGYRRVLSKVLNKSCDVHFLVHATVLSGDLTWELAIVWALLDRTHDLKPMLHIHCLRCFMLTRVV